MLLCSAVNNRSLQWVSSRLELTPLLQMWFLLGTKSPNGAGQTAKLFFFQPWPRSLRTHSPTLGQLLFHLVLKLKTLQNVEWVNRILHHSTTVCSLTPSDSFFFFFYDHDHTRNIFVPKPPANRVESEKRLYVALSLRAVASSTQFLRICWLFPPLQAPLLPLPEIQDGSGLQCRLSSSACCPPSISR